MVYTSPRRLAAGFSLLLLAASLLLASFAVARPAHAANFTVGTFPELVDAINAANATPEADTISLSADIVITGNILPDITSNITIEGNGHKIDGAGQFFMFYVEFANFNLNNITLTNGYGEDQDAYGAAVYNYGGTLKVNHATFSNNIVTNGADGYNNGGAIYTDSGTAIIDHTTFDNNQVVSENPGGFNGAFGGAIYSYNSAVSIDNSTFSNNQTRAAGSLEDRIRSEGGAILNFEEGLNKAGSVGKAHIAARSLAGAKKPNSAKPNLIEVSPGMTITNSTFFANQTVASASAPADIGSGGGAIENDGSLTLINTTFDANKNLNTNFGGIVVSGGGALLNFADLTLKNTIVANSSGGNNCDNEKVGIIFDAGNNLQDQNASCGPNIPVVNPGLDPAGLKNNGGPTQTVALLPGSPAINTVDPAACPPTDQRGVAREGVCDIGAFEFHTVVVNNGAPPPADLTGQLRITPDRVASGEAQNLVSYIFTVKNIGQGKAGAVSIELPIDPNLLIGYTEFSNANVWVSSLSATAVVVSLPDLENNQVVSGTIFFRPNTAPAPAAGTEISSRYNLKFTNPDGGSKTVWSNAASTEFGGSNTDVSQGVVQLMTADEPNGTKIVYFSDFWIPNEIVSTWLTAPDGTSVALTQGTADADGHFAVEVDAANLAAGTYVVAAYGARSEIYGSGLLVVTESGSSARPATGLGVKSLGAKALATPKNR